MNAVHRKKLIVLVYVALAIVTFAAYAQVLQNDFIDFDDDHYVTKNADVRAGLTWRGLRWAFTTTHASNWHPVTWLSHMLDCQLFGLEPGRHHLTSLLLHIANALLLFAVLSRMTGAFWRSAFVAVLFALHPVHAESVAWISERKDVLSTLFWLLTVAAYCEYVSSTKRRWYFAALVCFVLGLMSKPMLVTLPFVLLLLDYWPLGCFGGARLSGGCNERKPSGEPVRSRVFRSLVWEKTPFFLLSAISCIITFFAQRSGGAVAAMEIVSATARINNAIVSYVRYLGKLIWPSGLALFYPHARDTIPVWQVLGSVLLLLVISVAVRYLARRRKYLLVGWLWYLGMLVPVIGLVQVGGQAMADRYTYLPYTGLFIIAAWGAVEFVPKQRFCRVLLAVVAVVIVAALGVRTKVQTWYWRDSFTLFKHALDVTEDNYRMHFSLGKVYHMEGRLEEAIGEYHKSLSIRPHWFTTLYNLGTALFQQHKIEQAVAFYRSAVESNPEYDPALNNLAWLLATAENARVRNPAAAVGYAERACSLTEHSRPDYLDTLGAAYAGCGRFDEAIATAGKAIELAMSQGLSPLAEEIEDHLQLYLASKPYIEPSAEKHSE